MPADDTAQGVLPVIGEFKPIPGTMEEYELGSDFTRIFSDPPRGIVMHYAGKVNAEEVITGSFWIYRQAPLDFFAERVGDALTDLVKALSAPERDPDLSYGLYEVSRVMLGPAAAEFDRRPRGEANGAVLVRVAGGHFPERAFPETIASLEVIRDEGPVLYEFRTSAPESVAEDAEVIELHSIFTVAAGLDAIATT